MVITERHCEIESRNGHPCGPRLNKLASAQIFYGLATARFANASVLDLSCHMLKTTRPLIFVLVCLLGALRLLAQDPRQADSLYKDLVNYGVRDTTYLDKLHQLEISLVFVKPDSALRFTRQSSYIADSIGDTWRMARSANMQGNCFKVMGLHDRALLSYLDALKLFETTGDKKWIANMHSNVGLMQLNDGNYEQALREQQTALEIRKEIGYFKGISAAYNTIGNVYSALDMLPEALHYYELALDSAGSEGPYNKGAYLGNIGNIYGMLKQYESSRQMNLEAYELHRSMDLMQDMSRDLHNIGEVFLLEGNLDSAIIYNQRAHVLADSFHAFDVVAAASTNLKRAFVLKKDYEAAYLWAEKALAANDTLYQQRITAESRNAELLYRIQKEEEAAKIDQATTLLQKDESIKRQRILLISMGLGGLALIAFAVILVRRNRERNLANARLEFKVAERTHALSAANDQLSTEIDAKEQARQALNTFLYRSSHDLKGPLTSMKGLVDVAQTAADPSKYVHMIGAKAAQLDAILQQLIDKVEVDQRVLQPQVIDLNRIYADVLAELGSRKGFEEMRFELKADAAHDIVADPVLIHLALRQLLQNAVDFRRKGAADNACTLIAKGKDTQWILLVQDKGIGFDAAQLQNAFDMFTRGNSQNTGAGLGLYICKEIAARIGGSIQAESLPSGTVVTLTHT